MATPPNDLISPPDDLVPEEVAPIDLVSPPDDLITPEEPKPEKSFGQKYMEFDNAKDDIIIDAMDVVASTPAWLGGMAAGVAAGTFEALNPFSEGKPGTAAQAVKEGVMEVGANPIRRGLTATGTLAQPKEGEHTSIVAKGMAKIGEGLQAVEGKVTEVTGNEDIGKQASFFTEMLAPSIIHKGAKGIYVGGAKVVTKAKEGIVKTPEAKTIDPEYTESKIKSEEGIADVIQRKYERDALARKLDEGESTMGELPPEPVKTELTPDRIEEITVKAESGIGYLNNPPKEYSATDPIKAKNWAIKELSKLDRNNLDHEDAGTALRVLISKADEVAKGDQHPSVRSEHGITVTRNDNYIDVVELPENLQRKGLGTKIVQNLEYDIKKEGHKSAFLLAKEESVPFWEKQGYTINPAHVMEKGENVPMSKQLGQGKTRDTALSHTDKDGNITLNDTKIESDFKEGFPYIFEKSTPTGAQKAAVFEQIGVTKEDFVKAIPDVATYKDFLRVYEEAYAKYGEAAGNNLIETAFRNKKTGELEATGPKHPRGKKETTSQTHEAGFLDEQGKFLGRKEALDRAVETGQIPKDHFLDDLHSTDLATAGVKEFQEGYVKPKVAPIEARATLDALKAINKQSPADAVMANVYEFVTKEKLDHAASLESASLIIEKSLNSIIAEGRLVEIRAKGIIEAVPELVTRERMTRAGEGQKSYDKLMTDAERFDTIEGMSKTIDKWEKKLPPSKDGVDGATRLKRLKFAYEKVSKLPPEEHAISVLKDIRDYLKEIGDKAIQAGLLTELRNNYVPHVLDFSKSKLTPKEQADFLAKIANAPKESKLVRDFTQQRTLDFLRELEKQLEGTGVVVHTDIAKIVDAYGKSMHTAIIQKTMIDYLKLTKAADGNPFLLPDGPIAKELKYVPFESIGSKVIRDLRVHPDLADSMGFMFRERDPNVLVRVLGGVSHLTKALNTVGSLFHMKSLAEAGFLTDPVLFAKELSTGGAGMRAALRAFETEGKNPLVDLLIREGGLMIKVEDVQRTIVADTGAYLDNLATRAATRTGVLKEGSDLKLTQHITDPVDKVVLQRLNVWTWDYAHTAQKLNVAIHLFQKIKLKNPEIPDAVLAKEVSSYVNNTFGGLNWLQVANSVNSKFGRALALKMAGIAGRDWAQIVMFAPDWTISTLRAVTTALPKQMLKPTTWGLKEGAKGIFNPKTQGDLARRYVINTAIAYLTILNGINLAMSGQNIWDNKDPTRLAMGDGTSMQGAKHSMEAAHWLMHPDKTLGNKLGFWPKALFVSTTAVAYPSPDAPKLKDTGVLGRAKAVGTLALPFAASTAVQAPEGQAGKRALLSTLGLPIYGVTPKQMKEAQAKGRAEAAKKKLEAKREGKK